MLVVCTVREKAEQKLENIFLLLDVDFSEQLESVPIITISLVSLFSLRKFDRYEKHSKNSSSLPAVGAYSDITSSVSADSVTRAAVNLS